jgi:RimJ/RimL family protein N-acetyltransferase
LAGIGCDDLHVDVVIGAHHPQVEQIRSLCASHTYDCHVQTPLVADFMALADLGVGAGGSATWERCCLGLPSLTICVADNQRELIRDAASAGLVYSPDLCGDLTLQIRRHVITLMENSYLRYAISEKCMNTIDGSGASRVVGYLESGGIEVRPAQQEDSEKLFEWRNHPSVRVASRHPEVIAWETHEAWFSSVMNAPDQFLLLGYKGDIPLGVVRFDIHGAEAEVSIYRVPESLPSGRGRDLLKRAEEWISARRPDVLAIRAHILGANERSQRLFSDAGYQIESSSYLKRVH